MIQIQKNTETNKHKENERLLIISDIVDKAFQRT